jgi:hypothetical protein
MTFTPVFSKPFIVINGQQLRRASKESSAIPSYRKLLGIYKEVQIIKLRST